MSFQRMSSGIGLSPRPTSIGAPQLISSSPAFGSFRNSIGSGTIQVIQDQSIQPVLPMHYGGAVEEVPPHLLQGGIRSSGSFHGIRSSGSFHGLDLSTPIHHGGAEPVPEHLLHRLSSGSVHMEHQFVSTPSVHFEAVQPPMVAPPVMEVIDLSHHAPIETYHAPIEVYHAPIETYHAPAPETVFIDVPRPVSPRPVSPRPVSPPLIREPSVQAAEPPPPPVRPPVQWEPPRQAAPEPASVVDYKQVSVSPLQPYDGPLKYRTSTGRCTNTCNCESCRGKYYLPTQTARRQVGLGMLLLKEATDWWNPMVVVEEVVPGYAASVSGKVTIGDQIVSVDGVPVSSVEQVKQLTIGDEGTHCNVLVQRNMQTFDVTMTRVIPGHVRDSYVHGQISRSRIDEGRYSSAVPASAYDRKVLSARKSDAYTGEQYTYNSSINIDARNRYVTEKWAPSQRNIAGQRMSDEYVTRSGNSYSTYNNNNRDSYSQKGFAGRDSGGQYIAPMPRNDVLLSSV